MLLGGRNICKFLSVCLYTFIYKFKFFTRKIKIVKTQILKVIISECWNNRVFFFLPVYFSVF